MENGELSANELSLFDYSPERLHAVPWSTVLQILILDEEDFHGTSVTWVQRGFEVALVLDDQGGCEWAVVDMNHCLASFRDVVHGDTVRRSLGADASEKALLALCLWVEISSHLVSSFCKNS